MVPVKAEAKIDEEGTNKLIDAAIEIFSPGVEALGYLGDKIRVHRVRSAIRAFEKTKELARCSGLKLSAPPTKFLIQYIEASSLEEPDDDDLIDAWAALLLNASANENGEHAYFVSVLKQLSAVELDLLEMLARNRGRYRLGQIEDAQLEHQFSPFNKKAEQLLVSEPDEVDEAIENVIACIEPPGALVVDFFVSFSPNVDSDYYWQQMYEGYSESERFNWGILKSLNLIAEYDFYWECGELEYRARTYMFTPLGSQFYFACHEPGWRNKMAESVPYERRLKEQSERLQKKYYDRQHEDR